MPTAETTRAPVGVARWPAFSKAPSPWDDEKPIREELFGVERLQSHARSLAVAQKVADKPTRGRPLAGRLADNGAVLLSVYRSIVAATDDGRAITPAAEWLIDNYHLVEKQLRQIGADLPPGYYRQLPKLVSGPFAGYPRAFGMAWAYVAHTDSSFDVDILVAYVNAYQEIQPLTIGELWASSITLQIVLIENLRRLAQLIRSPRHPPPPRCGRAAARSRSAWQARRAPGAPRSPARGHRQAAFPATRGGGTAGPAAFARPRRAGGATPLRRQQ